MGMFMIAKTKVKPNFNNDIKNNDIKNKDECWVLASNNKGKLAEFKRMFDDAHLNVNLLPQGELGIKEAVEDGLSFVENAIIKARHASRISGLPAIADDSGLCVPVLGNAPGIHSARYAGEHGNDAKNNTKLIADLLPFRNSNRSRDSDSGKSLNSTVMGFTTAKTATAISPIPISSSPIKAYFVCVLVMVRHANDPLPIIAHGLWQGEILDSPLGEHGFGYDPLFWIPELQKSSAQLDAATKNQMSHRGRAMQSLLQQLKD